LSVNVLSPISLEKNLLKVKSDSNSNLNHITVFDCMNGVIL